MEVGDIVEVTKLGKYEDGYYFTGDKAKLISRSEKEEWLADFTMNKKYVGDGKWFIDQNKLKKIEQAGARDCSDKAPRNP